jgi:hypothetical protein
MQRSLLSAAEVVEYLPAAHEVHSAALVVLEYFPGEQEVQAAAFAAVGANMVPGAQFGTEPGTSIVVYDGV